MVWGFKEKKTVWQSASVCQKEITELIRKLPILPNLNSVSNYKSHKILPAL